MIYAADIYGGIWWHICVLSAIGLK